jgi:hypothetical protein
MNIYLHSADRQVTLVLNVKKIEALSIRKSDWEDDPFDEYYRSLRFITSDGNAIEVSCSAYDEQDLAIVEVAELLPLAKAER